MINLLFHTFFYVWQFLTGKLTVRRLTLTRFYLKGGNCVEVWVSDWSKRTSEISWVSHATILPRLKYLNPDEIVSIVHLKSRLTIDIK